MNVTIDVSCDCGNEWKNVYFVDKPTRFEPGCCELDSGEEICPECGSDELDMSYSDGSWFDPMNP